MTKTCFKCKESLDISCFKKNKSRKDGLQSQCIRCQKEYRRKNYVLNIDKHKEKIKKEKEATKKWYEEYKSGLKCELCPENHPACIQFHHKDPKEKDKNLSEVVRNGWSIRRIQKEIDKCMVLCGNCHSKLHWEEKQKRLRC